MLDGTEIVYGFNVTIFVISVVLAYLWYAGGLSGGMRVIAVLAFLVAFNIAGNGRPLTWALHAIEWINNFSAHTMAMGGGL